MGTSLEEAYGGSTPPDPSAGSRSVEDVYSSLPDDHHTKQETNFAHRALIDMENKRLAGEQFVHPDVEGHAPGYLGDAYQLDGDDAVHYKDEKGHDQATNKDKHVVLRDPEDQKYKVYKRNPDLEYGPITGRLIGLGRIVQEGLATSSPPIAKIPTMAQDAVKTIDKLKEATGVGVEVPKIAVTDSTGVKTTGAIVSKIPGSSGPFKDAAGGMAEDLGQAADAAAALPTKIAATPQIAGEATRSDIKDAVKTGGTLAQKVEDAYTKVTNHLKPDSKVGLDNTLATANKISAEYKASGREGFTNAVQEVLGPITTPGGINYQGLRRLTSDIGEMIGGNRELPAGMEVGDLKRIYGALKDDMKSLVAQSGKRASSALDKANATASVVARDREKLQTIFGNENRSDEAIFGRLAAAASNNSRADARLLGLVKRNVSDFSWNTIASGVIGRMGKVVTKECEGFDPGKFVKDYGSMSNRGKNLLFGTDGQLREALDSISKISERWPAATEAAHGASEVTHLAAGIGMFHKPLELLSLAIPSRWLAQGLSNPVTAKSAAKWAARYEELRLRPGSSTLEAFNNASRGLQDEFVRQDIGDIGNALVNKVIGLKEYVFGKNEPPAR